MLGLDVESKGATNRKFVVDRQMVVLTPSHLSWFMESPREALLLHCDSFSVAIFKECCCSCYDVVEHIVACNGDFFMDPEIEIQFSAMVCNGSRCSHPQVFDNDPYRGSTLPRRMVDPVLMESTGWKWTRYGAPPNSRPRWRGWTPGRFHLMTALKGT